MKTTRSKKRNALTALSSREAGSQHTCFVGLSERRLQADAHARDDGVGYFGQMNPEPLGLGKQPTDCGNSCLGSHSTTSGKSTVKAMVKKKTT